MAHNKMYNERNNMEPEKGWLGGWLAGHLVCIIWSTRPPHWFYAFIVNLFCGH